MVLDITTTAEKAKVVYPEVPDEEARELEEVHTPNTKTIEEVSSYLGEEKSRCLKAVDFMVQEKPVVVLYLEIEKSTWQNLKGTWAFLNMK